MQHVHAYLTGNLCDDAWQVVVLNLTMLHPRSEVAHLPVVTVIGQPHLRANMQDLVVVNDYATVVDNVLMHDWPRITLSVSSKSIYENVHIHANVAQDSIGVGRLQDLRQNFPRVKHRVTYHWRELESMSIQGHVSYLPRNDPDNHNHWRLFSTPRICKLNLTDVISSSGPTLIVAPRSFAMRMLCIIRSRLP